MEGKQKLTKLYYKWVANRRFKCLTARKKVKGNSLVIEQRRVLVEMLS